MALPHRRSSFPEPDDGWHRLSACPAGGHFTVCWFGSVSISTALPLTILVNETAMRFRFYSLNKLIRATSVRAARVRFGQLMPTLPAADFDFGRAEIAIPSLWQVARREAAWRHDGQHLTRSAKPTSERCIAVAVKQFWVHWVQLRGERRALSVRKLRRLSILVYWISRLRTRGSGVRISPVTHLFVCSPSVWKENSNERTRLYCKKT